MRLVFDLEATGLLHQVIDYRTLPFKLKTTHRVHCAVFKDLILGTIYKFRPENLEGVVELVGKATELIGHNILKYDMAMLKLYFGIDYEVDLEGKQDTVNGKPCTLTDTIIWSRVLNPDRRGGHSLKSWGKRLGVLKGDFAEDAEEEVWDTFTEDMLDYNEQDVEVNEAVYHAIMEEKGKWPWEDAYNTEKITTHLVHLSEHVGFCYDKKAADKCLKELNKWMSEIEGRVEPLLPPKKMGKTASKAFIPPQEQFKENGEMTSYMFKFLMKVGAGYKKTPAKHEVELKGRREELPVSWEGVPNTQTKKDNTPTKAMEKYLEEVGGKYLYTPPIYTVVYKGEQLTLPLEKDKPIEEYEPMRLANQDDMKQYLVRMGWSPTDWGEKDLTVDSKKRKRSWEDFEKTVRKYAIETKDSPYKKFRYAHLGVSTARQMYDKIMKRGNSYPVKVLSSPKYTTGQDKDLCPNLAKLGEEAHFVADVVKWLTYRHRRNSIESPKGTGFNFHYREDGRISTPAQSCGASTSRFKHSVVCNIARVTSVYGEPIRRLFGVQEDCYQIGYDFSGLEARVEGNYTIPYKGGEAYAVSLLAEKPNDVHSLRAKELDIPRDDAKTLKYSISYGAKPNKISSQMGWPLQKAKDIFEAFWDTALPLKQLKEDQTAIWLKTGKKFIKGVDNRKLWIRSEHSILNMLFQSTGVIAAKKANIFHNIELKNRGLLFNPFLDSSWDRKAAMMIHYHDEAQWCVHKSLVKKFVFDTEEEAKSFSIGERLLGGVHKNKDERFVTHFSPIGEIASQSCQKAAEYYKLNVKLAADYDVGKNWAECH